MGCSGGGACLSWLRPSCRRRGGGGQGPRQGCVVRAGAEGAGKTFAPGECIARQSGRASCLDTLPPLPPAPGLRPRTLSTARSLS